MSGKLSVKELIEKSKKDLDALIVKNSEIKAARGIGYALLAIAEALKDLKSKR